MKIQTNNQKMFFCLGLFLVVAFFAFPKVSYAATSVTQYGITWTFDGDYEVGQLVNGDYYVIDPGDGVKIININPGHALHPTTGRHMNGSMLNHADRPNGYDSYGSYDEKLNAGIGISIDAPLILTGDISLISTISNPEPADNISFINTASVLTCLSSSPLTGSFRPGISGTTKTIHNIGNVDLALLENMPSPIVKPEIAEYAGKLQMTWLAGKERLIRPSASGLHNYYFPQTFAETALLLHLDYTAEEKHDLLINFLQLGIDLHSYLDSGFEGWPADGGRAHGRKWPILFAGIMFDHAPMKNIGQVSGEYLYTDGYGPGNLPPNYKQFGEDNQTFYVSQSDVEATSRPLNCLNIPDAEKCEYNLEWCPDCRNVNYAPYVSAHLGMPEWGIRYATYQSRSDASWTANSKTRFNLWLTKG